MALLGQHQEGGLGWCPCCWDSRLLRQGCFGLCLLLLLLLLLWCRLLLCVAVEAPSELLVQAVTRGISADFCRGGRRGSAAALLNGWVGASADFCRGSAAALLDGWVGASADLCRAGCRGSAALLDSLVCRPGRSFVKPRGSAALTMRELSPTLL